MLDLFLNLSVYKRQIEEMSEQIKNLRRELEITSQKSAQQQQQQQTDGSTSQFLSQTNAQIDQANTPSNLFNKFSVEFKEKNQAVLPPIINQKSNENARNNMTRRSFLLQSSNQSNIMFTRLDAMQNLKRLKGAMSHGRISSDIVEVILFSLAKSSILISVIFLSFIYKTLHKECK
jgi:hypothetical protein